MTIDDAILAHYETIDEQGRLAGRARGELEFLRTRAVLQRVLPAAPARILDVGGGPGRYAAALAAEGYAVILVDPVPRHVEQARASAGDGVESFVAVEGDARSLAAADGSADAVILLGPLYHLDRAGRRKALAEALRVLSQGGVLVAAAISRFASLLDGMRHGLLADEDFMAIVRADLATGAHVNPDPVGRPEWFTQAWFLLPDELRDEVAEAGFAVEEVLAVEGPAALLGDLERRWADPDERRRLLDAVAAVEDEPSLLGASLHLLAVARRRD